MSLSLALFIILKLHLVAFIKLYWYVVLRCLMIYAEFGGV